MSLSWKYIWAQNVYTPRHYFIHGTLDHILKVVDTCFDINDFFGKAL